MDLNSLQVLLSSLPLGQIAYFDVIDSTNEYALQWAEAGAQHLSLVVADEQTAGRGRGARTWITPSRTALAFSLVLKSEDLATYQTTRITGLGALAVCQVLQNEYGLTTKIKWPNDVLVDEHKLAGVLVEADWQGDELQSVVLGIGINVARGSVPPESELHFPATSLEQALGKSIDRWNLLKDTLEEILGWLPSLDQIEFLENWEKNLAYKKEWVRLINEGSESVEGRLMGLEGGGSLRLELTDGNSRLFQVGEVHLRAVDRK